MRMFDSNDRNSLQNHILVSEEAFDKKIWIQRWENIIKQTSNNINK